jgi:hypothetical protein
MDRSCRSRSFTGPRGRNADPTGDSLNLSQQIGRLDRQIQCDPIDDFANVHDPVAVACLLVYAGMPANEAIALTRATRRATIERGSQVAMVERWGSPQ